MATAERNAALVRAFYDNFARGDAAGMNACYAPDVVFSDPVFGELRGDRARSMWSMLAAGMKDFNLTYDALEIDETQGAATCVATYTYSATGRRVRNAIAATFTFGEDGIVRHADTFDLWRWSAQALGLPGKLLGWTPFMQAKIRSMARSRLEASIAKH